MATGRDCVVTNEDIVRLAEAISAKNMEAIAMKYMGIDWETLENLRRENKEDAQAFSRGVIRKWCYMNSGPDQVKVSHNIKDDTITKKIDAPYKDRDGGYGVLNFGLVSIISPVLNTVTDTSQHE